MKIYRKLNATPQDKYRRLSILWEKVKAARKKVDEADDTQDGYRALEKEATNLRDQYDDLRDQIESGRVNAIAPHDRATLKELKAKMEKAMEDGEDAAFKVLQAQYHDLLDKAGKENTLKARDVAPEFNQLWDRFRALKGGKTSDIGYLLRRASSAMYDSKDYEEVAQWLKKVRPMIAQEEQGKRNTKNDTTTGLTPDQKAAFEKLEKAWEEAKKKYGVESAQVRAVEKKMDQFQDALDNSVAKTNSKFAVGATVSYGPYTWTVTKITPEGNYWLKQVGGNGQVAQDVRERELSAGKVNALRVFRKNGVYIPPGEDRKSFYQRLASYNNDLKEAVEGKARSEKRIDQAKKDIEELRTFGRSKGWL